MSGASAPVTVSRPGGLWLAFARNRLSWVGLALISAILIVAVFAPLIAPHDPLAQNIVSRLEPPSEKFLPTLEWLERL